MAPHFINLFRSKRSGNKSAHKNELKFLFHNIASDADMDLLEYC